MADKQPAEQAKPKYSKLKLAIGAASLFLFIVGVRHSYRPEEAPTSEGTAERTPEPGSPPEARG